MWEAEGFEYWWLIPLVLIALCLFWGRGCCFGWRTRLPKGPDELDATSPDAALEILSKRFARGEIDEEEYQRKSRIITETKKGDRE